MSGSRRSSERGAPGAAGGAAPGGTKARRTRAPRGRGRPAAASWLAEDRRLAALHLRLGGLALARAELEDLRERGELDAAGAADLAEARWRTGDLEGAAAAAADHLAMGGRRPIATVIAAEAAAAAGQPVEARAHVEALGPVDAGVLDALFAGMPRRAFWPSAPGTASATSAAHGSEEPTRPTAARRTSGVAAGADEATAHKAARGTEPADDATAGAEPADELAHARGELATGNAADAARGVARLALVLRLDPTLAPAVLGALGHRRDPAGLTVEGDACRLLGRHLEAEAAFAAARRALRAPDPDRRG
jgi:hypothetical protein